MDTIKAGLTGECAVTVTQDLTAQRMGSGSLAVYATPAMIALMEQAAVAAIDPLLPDGQASVGVELAVKHMAATPLGAARPRDVPLWRADRGGTRRPYRAGLAADRRPQCATAPTG